MKEEDKNPIEKKDNLEQKEREAAFMEKVEAKMRKIWIEVD